MSGPEKDKPPSRPNTPKDSPVPSPGVPKPKLRLVKVVKVLKQPIDGDRPPSRPNTPKDSPIPSPGVPIPKQKSATQATDGIAKSSKRVQLLMEAEQPPPRRISPKPQSEPRRTLTLSKVFEPSPKSARELCRQDKTIFKVSKSGAVKAEKVVPPLPGDEEVHADSAPLYRPKTKMLFKTASEQPMSKEQGAGPVKVTKADQPKAPKVSDRSAIPGSSKTAASMSIKTPPTPPSRPRVKSPRSPKAKPSGRSPVSKPKVKVLFKASKDQPPKTPNTPPKSPSAARSPKNKPASMSPKNKPPSMSPKNKPPSPAAVMAKFAPDPDFEDLETVAVEFGKFQRKGKMRMKPGMRDPECTMYDVPSITEANPAPEQKKKSERGLPAALEKIMAKQKEM